MRSPALSLRRSASVAAIAILAAAPVTAASPAPATPAPATPASATPAPAVAAVPLLGFKPAAASFVSAAWGVVLGGVGCSPAHGCPARLAVTADGGAHWLLLNPPPARLGGGRPQVSQIVFASRRNGWLYGQDGRGLWATHDGGTHWRKLSLGGTIETMAAAAGTAYAVVTPAGGGAGQLLRSPAGRDSWARVSPVTAGPSAVLAVSGTAAWLGASAGHGPAGVLWATADGVHWRQQPFRCPGRGYELSGIAAASRSHVVFLCTNPQGTFHTRKEVLRSANGGRTEHLAGHPPTAGDTGSGIAVPPHRSGTITIAVITPGRDFLDRSADGGKSWSQITAPGTNGGMALNSLAYQSRTQGWVVAGGPSEGGPQWLLHTSDGGRSWHRVSI